MRTLDDTTPLNGVDLDVASRVGWAVRMARITAKDAGDTRLQTMASLLGSSPAHLSRIETGQRRDTLLTRRYESSLGVPDSALGAPISTLCRAFPHRAPRDSGPLRGERTDVRAFSALTERLLTPGSDVSGGEWLDWARSLSAPGNIGLPVSLFTQITQRLLDELDRSVLHAVAPRYEAVALIRACPYGDLLLELSQPLLVPGTTHRTELLVGALSEQHGPESRAWALALLADESSARWGALALETMSQARSESFWADLAPTLIELFDTNAPGSDRERWSSHLIRLVPRTAWPTSLCPTRPLPGDVIDEWTPHALNPHWAWCELQATSMADEQGLAPQPILTRLVFDIALGPWEVRALTAHLLLTGLPGLADSLPERMAAYVDAHPEAPTRTRLLDRLGTMGPPSLPPTCTAWLTSSEPVLRATALTLAGRAGLTVDDVAALAKTTSADDVTTEDAPDADMLAAEARAALALWSERGGRVTR